MDGTLEGSSDVKRGRPKKEPSEEESEKKRLAKLEARKIKQLKFPIEDSLLPLAAQGPWNGPAPTPVAYPHLYFGSLVLTTAFINAFETIYNLPAFAVDDLLEIFSSNANGDSRRCWKCDTLHVSILRALMKQGSSDLDSDDSDDGEIEPIRKSGKKTSGIGREGLLKSVTCPYSDRDAWPEAMRQYLTAFHPELASSTQFLTRMEYHEIPLDQRIQFLDALIADLITLPHTRQVLDEQVEQAFQKSKELSEKEKEEKRRQKSVEAELMLLETSLSATIMEIASGKGNTGVVGNDGREKRQVGKDKALTLPEKKKRVEADIDRVKRDNDTEIQKWEKKKQVIVKKIAAHNQILRSAPIGRDRFHRRFWYADGRLSASRLYCEDAKTNRWFYFEEGTDLKKLRDALNVKGINELALCTALSEVIDEAGLFVQRERGGKKPSAIPEHVGLPEPVAHMQQVIHDITTSHVPTAILAEGVTQGFISSLEDRASKATAMHEIFDILMTLESSVQLLAVGPRWVRHRPVWLKRLEFTPIPFNAKPSDTISIPSTTTAEQPSISVENLPSDSDVMVVDDAPCVVPAPSPSPTPSVEVVDVPEMAIDTSIAPPSHVTAAMALEFQTALHKRVEDSNCIVCGSGISKRTNQVLLCDGCDVGYHMLCHVTPLSRVPAGKWYCHACVKSMGGDSGIIESDTEDNVRRSSRKRKTPPKKIVDDSDSEPEKEIAFPKKLTVTATAPSSKKAKRVILDDESSYSDNEPKLRKAKDETASSGGSSDDEDEDSEKSAASSPPRPPLRVSSRNSQNRPLRDQKRAVSPPRKQFARAAKRGTK